TDVSSAWSTIGVWGPRARDLVGAATADDVSGAALRYGTCRWIELGDVPALASRISYVGELGFEIYVPMETGAQAWDLLWEAGQPLGAVPVGIGVYGTTARLEKGYRAYGNELTPDYDLVEAGLSRRIVKRQAFVGKSAHLAQRSRPPAALCCTLTVDYGSIPGPERRYPLGHEAIVDEEGRALVDAKGRRSYVTSAGYGPSVGKHLLMAYLPPGQAVTGTPLAVEYCGERHPATVAAVGAVPLFDPDNERVRS
ncbi:MAG: aminomethyltransferase family protein, partial [Acidimicrobiales bacterium]